MKHSISYHTVPRETITETAELFTTHKIALETYTDQLLWWNERINLVSRDVPRETITNHIFHSLLLSNFRFFQEAVQIIDAGTGGGLPGIPLAITNPKKQFLLNDIVTKKVLAIKQIARTLTLNNVKTVGKSVAKLETDTPFLLISKHAFKINDLFHLTNHLPWKKMIFYKGADFEKELQDIDTPLAISVHDLFKNSHNEFYQDKAIIIVSKK